MTHSFAQVLWRCFKDLVRMGVFFLHAGLLVPGIVFWGIFLLFRGDMTALALALDNLISRYLMASLADQQNFLGLVAAGSSVIFVIIAGFRWRDFWRELHGKNIERGQNNEK